MGAITGSRTAAMKKAIKDAKKMPDYVLDNLTATEIESSYNSLSEDQKKNDGTRD